MRPRSYLQLTLAASLLLGLAAAASKAAPPELLINEVCPWIDCRLPIESAVIDPRDDRTGPWVELHNPGSRPVGLRPYSLRDRDDSMLTELPAWLIPAGGYLVVSFASGPSDADFSDGRGVYSLDRIQRRGALGDGAAGALLLTHRNGTVNDAVVWSPIGRPVSGAGVDRAIAAEEWPADRAFALADLYTEKLTRPLSRGESFGRRQRSNDTNRVRDWASGGGVHALGATPGGPNVDPTLLQVRGKRKRPRPAGPPEPGPRTWTVMLFMDGRDPNLLKAWVENLEAITDTGSTGEVQFVAQLYNGKRAIRWSLFKDLDLGDDKKEVAIPAAEPHNPGDPASLASFIQWAKRTYPARKYALVMSGHGKGWKGTNVLGLPEEGEKKDLLSMGELETGMKALERAFDTLIFESCLMGTAEVAYQVNEEATLMVASEEVAWGNLYGWKKLTEELTGDPSLDGEELSRIAADSYATAARDSSIGTAAKFTISVVSPPAVASELRGKIDTFAAALRSDVEDFREHDYRLDNLQVTIFEQVLTPAEKFHDASFRDLGHVAELARKQGELRASVPAKPLQESLREGGNVVLLEHHGGGHPDAHGLSIYFPHAQVKPDEKAKKGTACGATTEHCGSMPVFDKPRPSLFLYQRDPDFRLPRLESTVHTMTEEATFWFPLESSWDEFLHRFYKPVADACIRHAGSCVPNVTVEVGTEVVLSGDGSSDIDTDRSQKKHRPKRWYWDLDTTRDIDATLPDYQEGKKFFKCAKEDCDRDETDDVDDDPDADEKLVDFTCEEPGTYQMRLMTWDDHNTHEKEFREDERHNEGRHWLHFNLDDRPVTVTCTEPTEPTTKRASRDRVRPGETLGYAITVEPTGEPPGPEPASIIDPLAPEVFFVEGTLSCPEGGDCLYDETTHTVVWEGLAEPGVVLELVFDVIVRDDVPCEPGGPGVPPPEIVNRAQSRRGTREGNATVQTALDCEPPSD